MGSAAQGSLGVRSKRRPGPARGTRALLAREFARTEAAAARPDEDLPLARVASFFERRVDDTDARAAIEAARRRAARLAAGSQRPGRGAAVSFAGDAFDVCALDCGWGAAEAAELVAELSEALDEPRRATAAALFLAASRNPQLLQLPPRIALQLQLELVLAFAPVDDLSLWTRDSTGRVDCVAQIGAPTRTMRRVAKQLLHGGSGDGEGRQTIVGVPVLRWDLPWAALVARRRPDDRAAVDGYLAEAATTICPILERDMLLERSSARERALVDASEKRLLRLGFDLHDGPLQELAALAEDLRFTRARFVPLVEVQARELASGRFDDFEARLGSIDRNLRELSHSLESTSVVSLPLPRVLEREVSSFRNETGISVELSLRGQFEPMTRSQKIALFRIVQEALHNVRDHSSATEVTLDVVARVDRLEARIADDGIGFDVTHTLFDAARRGRMGLVGMGERARLLGGKLDVQSRVGGPTVIVLTLPRAFPIAPPVAEAEPAAVALSSR